MAERESDTLMGDDDRHPTNGYNTVAKDAGIHGPRYTRRTVIGEVRNWKRFSWLEWMFVVVASLSILGILGVSIQRFVHFEDNFLNISINSTDELIEPYLCNNWTCTNDFIFTVVLVLNTVFSAMYVVDGLLRERMFALVGYGATIAIIMIYVIANYGFSHERLENPLRLVRLVLVVIMGPINILLSSVISYKMGFFIFTTVGSNTTLIRAYKIRSFLVSLHWMLLQFMANLLALSWSRDGHFIQTAEQVIVCLLLAHAVLVVMLGWITVMLEIHWLVPVWYLTLAPYFAYFVYKLVDVVINFHDDYSTEVIIYEPGKVHTNFMYIGLSMMLGCLLGLVILVLMYTFMAFSLRNFRKGLRDAVPPFVDEWRSIGQNLTDRLRHKLPPSPLP